MGELYAFEAWLENPFAMKFPVDFSVISIESDSNVTLLGGPNIHMGDDS